MNSGRHTGEEDAPTAGWPVPDYSEPPDRRSPGRHTGQAPWPVPPQGESPSGPTGRARGERGRPAPAEEDPETFTFERPSFEGPAPAGPAGEHPPLDHLAAERPPAGGRRPADRAFFDGPTPAMPLPAVPPPAAPSPVAPPAPPRAPGAAAWQQPAPAAPPAAWRLPVESPAGPPPVSDGFSYWERPAPRTRAESPAHEAVLTREPAGTSDGDAGPEEAPEPAPARRPREPYLDNVKFLLIALVPAGHALVPTLATHSSRAAYLFIYVFHMPLFVIISGYLSRNFWNSNAKTNKLVDTFLVPYVIVEIGYAALRFAMGHKWSLTIIDPAWLNWYLLALLLWRLSTPVWKRMRYPLPIAVAVYLLAGLSDLPGDFSMDRFFGLMPFFVLGLWLQPRHFEMLNRGWIKVLAVGVLAGAAAVAVLIAPRVPLDPVYYKDAYAELDMSWWMGMGMRAALLVAALTISAAILALVPRRTTWFTDLGTRTLYCYLLHGVPVYIAKEMGWLEYPWLHGPLGVMAIVTSCFALAIVLCLPETRSVFKWLLEPRLTWLYRRPAR
ncbi:hypothetical protein Sru01_04150 [Sphaerisporangium rufum]|uniref:Acyltransferase 3 domain-containing protein n=1 Tax=Sphaerisporangium rufum TaxID=1381558 RepID=A0A919UZC8_9ACTN|nr:acyltransferase family protein [Sphaerisporangium rufum]GII75433.1 hypothetical protein Sru01_04150 [Sphaerisporangium rufum]